MTPMTCPHAEERPGTAGTRLEARTASKAAHSCPDSGLSTLCLSTISISPPWDGTVSSGVGSGTEVPDRGWLTLARKVGARLQPKDDLLMQTRCRCSAG